MNYSSADDTVHGVNERRLGRVRIAALRFVVCSQKDASLLIVVKRDAPYPDRGQQRMVRLLLSLANGYSSKAATRVRERSR